MKTLEQLERISAQPTDIAWWLKELVLQVAKLNDQIEKVVDNYTVKILER